MKTNSRILLRSFLLVALALGATSKAAEIKPHIFETYPERIQAKIENRDRLLRRHTPATLDSGARAESVIRITKLWKPGQKLNVAFFGGTKELRQEIERIALTWTNSANLAFAFRNDNGQFREWSRTQAEVPSDIRISFDEPGYWSMIGTDCLLIDSTNATMNFQDFQIQKPSNWTAVVLHEFGHMLGFDHEHQHPTQGCEDEFRWQDDAGYQPEIDRYGMYIANRNGARPGVYTWYSGYPNYWPACKVDCSLRKLKATRAFPDQEFDLSKFDVKSIMKYFFDDWMFLNSSSSFCYALETFDLSEDDRKGAARHYPYDQNGARARDRIRTGALNQLMAVPNLPQGAKKNLEKLEFK